MSSGPNKFEVEKVSVRLALISNLSSVIKKKNPVNLSTTTPIAKPAGSEDQSAGMIGTTAEQKLTGWKGET